MSSEPGVTPEGVDADAVGEEPERHRRWRSRRETTEPVIAVAAVEDLVRRSAELDREQAPAGRTTPDPARPGATPEQEGPDRAISDALATGFLDPLEGRGAARDRRTNQERAPQTDEAANAQRIFEDFIRRSADSGRDGTGGTFDGVDTGVDTGADTAESQGRPDRAISDALAAGFLEVPAASRGLFGRRRTTRAGGVDGDDDTDEVSAESPAPDDDPAGDDLDAVVRAGGHRRDTDRRLGRGRGRPTTAGPDPVAPDLTATEPFETDEDEAADDADASVDPADVAYVAVAAATTTLPDEAVDDVPEPAPSVAELPPRASNDELRAATRAAAAAQARARVADTLASELAEAARIASEECAAAVAAAAEHAAARRAAEAEATARVSAANAQVAEYQQLAEQATAARREAEQQSAEHAQLAEEARQARDAAEREAAEYARLAEEAVGTHTAEAASAEHADALASLRAELRAAEEALADRSSRLAEVERESAKLARRLAEPIPAPVTMPGPVEAEPAVAVAVERPILARPRVQSGPASRPRTVSLEPPSAGTARALASRALGRVRQGLSSGAEGTTTVAGTESEKKPDPEPEPAPEVPTVVEVVQQEAVQQEPQPQPVRSRAEGPTVTYERVRGLGITTYVAVPVAALCLLGIALIAAGGDITDRVQAVVVLGAIALAALFVAVLRRSTRSSVLLDSSGVLTMVLGGSNHVFDLSSSNVPIEMSGEPGGHSWKMQIRRRSMSPLVVDSRAVESRAFTAAVRQWRPEL